MTPHLSLKNDIRNHTELCRIVGRLLKNMMNTTCIHEKSTSLSVIVNF